MTKSKKIIITIISIIFSISLCSGVIYISLPQKYSSTVKELSELTYKITFNTDGGSEIPHQILKPGDKITIPPTPTKEGYDFVEWTYKNQLFDFDIEVMSDMEITAKWFKITHIEPPTEEPPTEEPPIEEPTIPEDKPETKPEPKPETKPEVKPPTVKYTVTFDSRGGSSVKSQTIIKGKPVAKPTNPTRAGYKFVNWQYNGKTYNFSSPVNGNIKLIATWKPIEYVISYNLNGGTNNNNKTTFTVEHQDFQLTAPTRKNYIFLGWNGSNGDKIQSNITVDTSAMKNLTYKANWLLYGDPNNDGKYTQDDYDIIDALMRVEYKTNSKDILYQAADLNKDGKVNILDKEIYLGIQNKKITDLPFNTGKIYTITYKLDNGNFPEGNYKKVYSVNLIKKGVGLSLPTPTSTRDRYTFKGWKLKRTAIQSITSIPTNTTGNITLYSDWRLR